MPRTKTASFAHAKHAIDATVKIPGTRSSILSETSKMVIEHLGILTRVPSFSLPALKTCPGAVISPDLDGRASVCGGCYATKGSYRWSTYQDAAGARMRWVRESLRTPEGTDVWVWTMVEAIRHATRYAPYFRIHDSGDFFSPAYAGAWYRVAEALPQVRFWAPTRNYHANVPTDLRDAVKRLASLPNVTVRPSALHVDVPAPAVDGLSAGSAVQASSTGLADHSCPAPSHDGACLDCRACWDRPTVSVAYHVH